MIRIEKNYLNVAGIKFYMPQDFSIDIEEWNRIHPDGLRFVSAKKDCNISFMTTELEYCSPVDSLMDIFTDDVFNKSIVKDMFKINDTGYILIEEPKVNEINGLKYAYVKYQTPYNYYYEIHFERVNGAGKQLEVLLEISKKSHVDIETVLNRQNVKDFYKSFVLA